MIPRYCVKADRCSYGKNHNPCDLHENCPAFRCDTTKHFEELKEKKSKYHNKKVVVDGITFDSKKEYNRWCELQLLQKSKVITDLKRQVKYVLVEKNDKERETSYIADFVYKQGNEVVVEDVKSKATKTPLYRLKRKLMLERYNIKIKEV
jgi:hypothetical protein